MKNDARFTYGLVIDVAEVIRKHGYPAVTENGYDMLALQQALFVFLYAPRGRMESAG